MAKVNNQALEQTFLVMQEMSPTPECKNPTCPLCVATGEQLREQYERELSDERK